MLFRSRRLKWEKKLAAGVIALMGTVPVMYACLRHPALYDAVRHFIFVIPLLCVGAAYAVVEVMRWALSQFQIPRARKLVAAAFLALWTVSAAGQIVTMADLHPYEYIYANRFAGGVNGIYGRYELDYWGTSFKEAVERLQTYVAKEGGIPAGKMYRIAICGPWAAAMI